MNFIEKILDYKKDTIKDMYTKYGINYYQEQFDSLNFNSYSFFNALNNGKLNLIAEIKKGSPSKGIINNNFDPLKLSVEYAQHGASALSVLTDEKFFYGSNLYLSHIKHKIKLPILRKDFIIDPIQVFESKAIGADALLLIIDFMDVDTCQMLIDLAAELRMDVLLEIHDNSCLKKLLMLRGLKIIGINNRCLKTFTVSLEHSIEMKKLLQDRFSYCLFVAESGYSTKVELDLISKHSFNAVLIGEGLVNQKGLLSYFQ
tara:strand:- start:128 stop:904 length:777 start_codon:yes stop_codon:yes gene_type:complete